MGYDESSAERVRRHLAGREIVEKKMMGGMVFMVDGHMCCGLSRDSLMVRIGNEARDAVLALPHVRKMMIGERSPNGFVRVDPEGWQTDAALAGWLQRGLDFIATLPPKAVTAKPRKNKPR